MVIGIVADVIITVVITGPIAPPIILSILVEAEEIPVYCVGVSPMMVTMTVFGIIALAIPKIKRPVLIPGGAEWKNKRIKNEMALTAIPVSYTHLRAHETPEHLVCRLLLEKKKK